MADPSSYPGTPRWAKMFGIVVLLLVLLFIVLLLIGGGHGPGRHRPSGRPGVYTPFSSAAERGEHLS